MIIISHDRHFLNSVCTHMADLDYGELRVYPGNYDEYMTAATQVRDTPVRRQRQEEGPDCRTANLRQPLLGQRLQGQAGHLTRQRKSIKSSWMKSSPRAGSIRSFVSSKDKKLHRLALEVEGLSKGYDGDPLFNDLNLTIEVGERVAIIGPNGIGKTTLLRTPGQRSDARCRHRQMVGKRRSGLLRPGPCRRLRRRHHPVSTGWANGKQPGDDEQTIRGTLGRLLFSNDEINKSVKVISGGEQGRMLFGKLMLQKPNILVMDEPTNHLDMESIESLNTALENYPGTLIFVSHDREFVSSLATRIIELTPTGVVDFSGNYEDYLRSQGVEVPGAMTAGKKATGGRK